MFEIKERHGSWRGKRIFSFNGADGQNPNAALVQDKTTGLLYGTTQFGGAYGWGTVFSLTPSDQGWSETVLHSFTADTDGDEPDGRLVIDPTTGSLLGTASSNVSGNPSGCGDIFEISNAGNFSPLYEFQGGSDGCIPETGLFKGISTETYFGTTRYNQGGKPDKGTVYKFTGAGGQWAEVPIYEFPKESKGSTPNDLAVVSDNLVYGAAEEGGNGYGVIFQLRQTRRGWKEEVLYAFAGGADGAVPVDIHYEKSSGIVYGVTDSGGTNDAGTIFELTNTGSQWTHAVLHSFGASGDGIEPVGKLIEDPNTGIIYGATRSGGEFSGGTAFSFVP